MGSSCSTRRKARRAFGFWPERAAASPSCNSLTVRCSMITMCYRLRRWFAAGSRCPVIIRPLPLPIGWNLCVVVLNHTTVSSLASDERSVNRKESWRKGSRFVGVSLGLPAGRSRVSPCAVALAQVI